MSTIDTPACSAMPHTKDHGGQGPVISRRWCSTRPPTNGAFGLCVLMNLSSGGRLGWWRVPRNKVCWPRGDLGGGRPASPTRVA